MDAEVRHMVVTFETGSEDPEASDDVAKDQENQYKKEQTLETNSDLEDLRKVLYELVSLFDDLEHPD
jgi:hypothetical protein